MGLGEIEVDQEEVEDLIGEEEEVEEDLEIEVEEDLEIEVEEEVEEELHLIQTGDQ